MITARISVVAGLTLVSVAAYVQQVQSEDQLCKVLTCMTSFELPRSTNGITPSWLGNNTTAIVTVRFDISNDGRAINARASAPTAELERFTLTRISNSLFKKECAGRSMKLSYEYETMKGPVPFDLPAITLRQGSIHVVFAARQPSTPLQLVKPQ